MKEVGKMIGVMAPVLLLLEMALELQASGKMVRL